MFGDYYAYDKWHQNQISATNTNNVKANKVLVPAHLLRLRPDLQAEVHHPLRARGQQQQGGPNPGNINPYIKDAY